MFQVPKYFILIFVGLSILAAYGVSRFQSSEHQSSLDLASSPEKVGNHLNSVSDSPSIDEKIRVPAAFNDCPCSVVEARKIENYYLMTFGNDCFKVSLFLKDRKEGTCASDSYLSF